MTKRYFARYFIETPNAVGNRRDIESGKVLGWKFNFGNNVISLYDHRQGLWADCYIEAESLEAAEGKSKTFVENILNLTDFSTSSASNSPLFVSIYDTSPNLLKRGYKQIFYIDISERNISRINQEIFGVIFKNFGRNKDARIVRAIAWLRKGYLETNYIDKFIAFWTGLESLNGLLCDYFGIPAEDRKLKCNRCGKEISNITSVGIKKLFVDEIKINRSKFKKIRKARGKLLHGRGPLNNDFIAEIKKYLPFTRRALIVSIGKLLSIENKVVQDILNRQSRVYSEKMRIILKANLTDFVTPNIDEFGKQPRVDLEDQNLLKRIIDEQGKLTKKLRSKFTFRNATFNNIVLELLGDENTALESAKIIDIK